MNRTISRSHRISRRLAGTAAALLLSVAVQAQVRSFDIPAGDLKTAIDAFVAQTRQQLVYRSDDLKGLRSKGVQGSLRPEQALERLLDGTALKLRRDASGALVLFLGEAAAGGTSVATATASSTPLLELQTVIVTGSATSHLAETNRTGTRTDIDPMALPQSVSTVRQELLRQQQVRNVADAVANVAGVSGTGQDDGLLTMRGFPAGVMRNGNINTSVGSTSTFNSPMITVARIEVVKGPEAIIAGVSATYGGVVNVITKAPQVAPVRDIELSLGSRSYYQVGADLGNPLNSDKTVLGRLVLSKQGEGREAAGYNGSTVEYAAPSLSWSNKPSGTGLVLSYEHQRSWTKNPLRVYFAPGQPFDPNVPPAFIPPADAGTQDQQSVASLALTQRLVPGWELGFKLSRDQKESNGLTFSGRSSARLGLPYPNIIATAFASEDKRTTRTAKLELKGSFNTGPVEHGLLLAIDDLSTRSESSARTTSVTVVNLATGQSTDETATLGPALGVPLDFGTTLLNPREQGMLVYDHMVWGSWVALVGWRQMRIDQGDPLSPDQAPFKKGLPSLGVVYRWTPTLSLYGSASKGFQPNIGALTATLEPIKPESSAQAELGFKALLADRKIALSAAAYRIQQRNVAVPDFDNSPPDQLFFLSVPGVTARGVEVELSGNLTPRLNLRAGYAYLDKKADSPEGLGVVYVRHQASLWSAYRLGDEVAAGWWVGGGLQARSGAAGVAGSFGGWIPTPGETRIDLNGGYDTKQWAVVVGAKNLTNRRLYSLVSRGDRSGALVQAREFYATARYSF
jgi:iron complex outermembrane recepter protein